ncbi:MAG: hypothetical protein IJT01_07540 [Selenomonadaceae bacterium]|nr:hypothetical protein [Selenomonadaceae bacterium]
MSMQIKNNMSAVSILNRLNANHSSLTKSLQQLSSGMKINSAGDDTSCYSISERMRLRIRGLEQCNRNVLSGQSLLKVALGGLEEIKKSLEEMTLLADQAANDTLTDSDRATVQKVFSQLRENIDSIAVETNFNGITPLHPMGKQEESAPESSGGKLDVVFLVDTTSSMGTYIKNVASNMTAFTDKLEASNTDYRIAIASFNEQHLISSEMSTGLGEMTAQELDFTSSSTAVSSKLNQIANEVWDFDSYFHGGPEGTRGIGGHYEPESGLEGVQTALSLTGWRDGANRQIIVITDASFHNSTDSKGIETIPVSSGNPHGSGTAPSDYQDVNDIISALQATNTRLSAVTLSSTNPAADNSPATEWGWLADATGGEVLSLTGNYGANLSYIASAAAEAAGGTGTGDDGVKWRDILRADNGFSLGSAFITDTFIHTGPKANESVSIPLFDHTAKRLKLDTLDITTRENALYTRECMDIVIQKILDHSTMYGAYASRLDAAHENLTIAIENTVGSESTIRDADMAKAMVWYTKNNLLLQASQSMLAQANHASEGVLGLLQ